MLRWRLRRIAAILTGLMLVWSSALCLAGPPALSPAPPTPQKPVVDIYNNGVPVTDDYRWLEDAGDASVKAWSDAQNGRTRAFLDALPARKPILEHIKHFIGQLPQAFYMPLERCGGVWFAFKFEPAQDRQTIVTLSSLDDLSTEKRVFDSKTLDPSGLTSVGIVEPSPDGKLIAISVSKSGSEIDTLHLYEVETGRDLGDVIPRVSLATGGGSVSWNRDGSGFYYTRYPAESERPRSDLDFYQQVYYHQLGAPASADAYSVGKQFPRIAETRLSASPDFRYHLARVGNGPGGEYAFYLLGPSGQWTQVADFKDGVKAARFGPDEALYLRSVAGAPKGRILRVPLTDPTLSKAAVIVPQSGVVIEQFLPTTSRLFVLDLAGGPSQLRVFDLHGRPLGNVAILPVSTILSLEREGGDTIVFRNDSYTQEPATYRYDPHIGRPVKIAAMTEHSGSALSNIIVKQEFAVSRDGTRVPMHILYQKGLRLTGTNPTLLSGYGGYGVNSLRPSADEMGPDQRIWLENGGVVVHTGLRGGGEYGEAWHLAGNLTKKQNVFDDFLACAQYLVAHKYTSAPKLAIIGASNGGLLMGAALTQRPDLFRAVVTSVGMYDMLRFELAPNGAFNVTEFGSVKNAEQFIALSAYSPYHHVLNGTSYPAVLLTSGDNDGRVDPMQSRKMTARLQAATSSGHPILLRTSATSGHSASTLDEIIGEYADSLAFLFNELGVIYSADRVTAQ